MICLESIISNGARRLFALVIREGLWLRGGDGVALPEKHASAEDAAPPVEWGRAAGAFDRVADQRVVAEGFGELAFPTTGHYAVINLDRRTRMSTMLEPVCGGRCICFAACSSLRPCRMMNWPHSSGHGCL